MFNSKYRIRTLEQMNKTLEMSLKQMDVNYDKVCQENRELLAENAKLKSKVDMYENQNEFETFDSY